MIQTISSCNSLLVFSDRMLRNSTCFCLAEKCLPLKPWPFSSGTDSVLQARSQ